MMSALLPVNTAFSRPEVYKSRGWFAALLFVALAAVLINPCRAQPIRGMPYTRSYPLDDIGYVPRGSRLAFDGFGRLAVVHADVFTVLNDTSWLNLVERENRSHTTMPCIVRARDGRIYYGSRGSCGIAEMGEDGKLHARSLCPDRPPKWVSTSEFDKLVATDDGVYFGSINGIVYYSFEQSASELFELKDVARIFPVGNRVYVSVADQPLRYIDLSKKELARVNGVAFDGVTVEFATPLDQKRTLVALLDGRLMVFDGEKASPWEAQQNFGLWGRISALRSLVDGHVAIAIGGKGVYIISAAGDLALTLATPQYQRVTDLANYEAGVLWIAAEDSIEKVFYGSPLTSFGQRLGLPLSWPVVANCGSKTYVSSDGKLYEAASAERGEPSRFVLSFAQPPGGAWSLASVGSGLLAGNMGGVFALEPDGAFTRIGAVKGLAHLAAAGADLCFAIGTSEIAVFRHENGRWVEAAPRIPGIASPAVVHSSKNSVWIETGSDGVVRLSLKQGQIQSMRVDPAVWKPGVWVNVGVLKNAVVLSGEGTKRLFFDEDNEKWVENPKIQRLIERSPYWVTRISEDETGIIWAAHSEGVIAFIPNGDDYDMDVATFDFINDRFPVVRVLPGNDVWISAAQSLQHVELSRRVKLGRVAAPTLVSVTDSRTGRELLTERGPALKLPFRQNSLFFRFFSGSYATRRAPQYEFRLSEKEPWAPVDTGSLLSLRGLHEAHYTLQVRRVSLQGDPGSFLSFEFDILPPWSRTWEAYALYGITGLLALGGAVAWASRSARRRNLALERQVRERTDELKVTMEKLNEEARNAATLAERNRLAGEIHDSLQQGLSGAILQLDTTLKLQSVSGEVRTRLAVIRNMVSYIRQEVLHAVWDMQSPLLEGTDLGEALKKLTGLINSGNAAIEISVSGDAFPLPRNIQHNLLRIAQEATSNAVRHAAAKKIEVHLTYDGDVVSLTISDDGVGFRTEDALATKVGHFGLRGIKSRAKKLGGSIDIQSAPGHGTVIRVTASKHARLATLSDAIN